MNKIEFKYLTSLMGLMKEREKILNGIANEPYAYMYHYVSDALQIGIPVLDIIDSIANGLRSKRDTYMGRSEIVRLLLSHRFHTSHENVTFEEVEKMYKSAVKNLYEEAKQKDHFWGKAVKANYALTEIEKMKMSPDPTVNRSSDVISNVIMHAMKNGADSAMHLLDKRSVSFEGVIVERDRSGEFYVKLASQKEFEKLVEAEDEAVEDYAVDLFFDCFYRNVRIM